MKNFLVLAVITVLLFGSVTIAQDQPTSKKDKKKKEAMANTTLSTQKEKVSYAIGIDIGKNFKKNLIDVDPNILLTGIKEGLVSDTTSLLSETEIATVMQEFQKEIMTKQAEVKKGESSKNKKEGEAFLKENAKKEGVKVTKSGLQYKVITEGKGKTPTDTSTVSVHYRGTLIDGKEFDSSIKRGQPAEFPVNGVIKGWTEALQLMKEGDKWMLYIPSDLAYGDQGAGGVISPGSTLIFEVELLSIK